MRRHNHGGPKDEPSVQRAAPRCGAWAQRNSCWSKHRRAAERLVERRWRARERAARRMPNRRCAWLGPRRAEAAAGRGSRGARRTHTLCSRTRTHTGKLCRALGGASPSSRARTRALDKHLLAPAGDTHTGTYEHGTGTSSIQRAAGRWVGCRQRPRSKQRGRRKVQHAVWAGSLRRRRAEPTMCAHRVEQSGPQQQQERQQGGRRRSTEQASRAGRQCWPAALATSRWPGRSRQPASSRRVRIPRGAHASPAPAPPS